MSLKNLQIKNLRSLVDTGIVEFKKINILLGQNSSGKSSFVRTLPLLKQSAQVRTLSDILWYGPLVDFGSFSDALSTHSDEDYIELSMELPIRFNSNHYSYQQFFRPSRQDRETSVQLKLRLREISTTDKVHHQTQYLCRIYDHEVDLVLEGESMTVKRFCCAGFDFTEEASSSFTCLRQYGLLPLIYSKSEFREYESPFSTAITSLLKTLAHGKTSKETLQLKAQTLQVGTEKEVVDQLKKFKLGKTWDRRLSELEKPSKTIEELTANLLARDFHLIFRQANEYLTEVVQQTQYITPLRATAERYYRSQGLSVDEIDPQGRNLAMFLTNLSLEEAKQFAEWTGNKMGFEAHARSDGGHVSIFLKSPGQNSLVNLADTGFGYSQVLPILAQVWQAKNDQNRHRRRQQVPKYFVIEQPELHLHPRMQARLADLFLSAIEENNETNIRFIIETHSEAIVNQIGKAIEKRRVHPDDIGIYIFGKDSLAGHTTVQESGFDQEGFLTKWPYGFFDAEN